MSNGNYIKLNRSILEWEWYDDVNVARVFIHLLLTANYKAKKWHGIQIERGQRIISISGLADETGLTVQQTRTALDKLIATGEITKSATSRYTLITVENYSKFQDVPSDNNKPSNTQPNKQATNKQQTNNNNIRKKEREERKEGKNYIYSRATHDIIQHLNGRIGANYKPTTNKTKDLIQARMNEGFTVEDFKTVIDKKCVEWMNTDMQKFLRPETLFGTKFESYLNAPVNQKQEESLWERIARGDFDE